PCRGRNIPRCPASVPDAAVEGAELRCMNTKMLTSFTDGTKTQSEMAALANATGYSIATPGMHGAAVDLDGLAATLRPAAEGGIITTDGPVVEYVTGDVAPGVFVVVRSDSEVVTEELHYLRLP